MQNTTAVYQERLVPLLIQVSPHPLLIALRNLRRGLASRLGLELYDRKKLEEEAKKLGKLDISDAADIIINYINAKKISEQKHL